VGTDDGIDSDANPLTGITATFVVGAAQVVLRDIGLVQQRVEPELRIHLPTEANNYRFELRVPWVGGTTIQRGPIDIRTQSPEDARAILLDLLATPVNGVHFDATAFGTTAISVKVIRVANNFPSPISSATVLVSPLQNPGRVPIPSTRGGVTVTQTGQFSATEQAGTPSSAWLSFPGEGGYALRLILTTDGSPESSTG
jgi:hypothetical protein